LMSDATGAGTSRMSHQYRRRGSNVAGGLTLIPTLAATLTLVRTLWVGNRN